MLTVEQNKSFGLPVTIYSIATGQPLTGLTFAQVSVNFLVAGSPFAGTLSLSSSNFVEVDAINLPGCYVITFASNIPTNLGPLYIQIARNPLDDVEFQEIKVQVVPSTQDAILDPLADIITDVNPNVQISLGETEQLTATPVTVYLSNNRLPVTTGLSTLGVDYQVTEYFGGVATPAVNPLVAISEGVYTYTPSTAAVTNVGNVVIRISPQTQWQLRLTSVPFLLFDVSGYSTGPSTYRLLACGTSGQVVESVDSGETWTTIGSFPITPLEAFRASASRNTGLAIVQVVAGDSNRFFYRTNPANPFVSYPNGVGSSYNGVTIADETNVWTCGPNGVIKKFDGVGFTIQKNSGQSLNAIYALNIFDVWSVGNLGTVFRTTDGGTIWTDVSALFGGTFANFQDITFSTYGSGRGFIVGDECWRTSNFGNSWEQIPLPDSNVYYDVNMSDFDDQVWIFGTGGAIYYSTDFGTTWQKQTTPDDTSTMFGAYISPTEAFGVAVGTSGQSWKLIDPPQFDALVGNYRVSPILSDIRGAGYNPATDSLEQIRDSIGTPDFTPVLTSLNEIKGVGFNTSTDSLVQIRQDVEGLDTAVMDALTRLLGLTQENFRTFDHVYDTNNALTSSKIRIYPSASDTNADTNPLAEYQVSASYDGSGRLSNYSVIRTF